MAAAGAGPVDAWFRLHRGADAFEFGPSCPAAFIEHGDEPQLMVGLLRSVHGRVRNRCPPYLDPEAGMVRRVGGPGLCRQRAAVSRLRRLAQPRSDLARRSAMVRRNRCRLLVALHRRRPRPRKRAGKQRVDAQRDRHARQPTRDRRLSGAAHISARSRSASRAFDRNAYAADVDLVRIELADDPTVDITTTGRRSGLPRSIEIWMLDVDGRFFIAGTPGRRDWLANLTANPRLVVHLKRHGHVDLAAGASVVVDVVTRRAVLAHSSAAWYRRQQPLDVLIDTSPLVEVKFDEQAD
jgi:deazaflavin-dependent oxidoreductase (nitroreductase family)